MAGELIWALEALDDIDAIARYIARYIARDSAVYARRVVSEILELGELLLTQPLMGGASD
ncbi:type II toxin-antitoxin system RelE/ParE family toxin [uncultured Lamprocystis sp.]|jgi:plasmid stabilization system protein ParE|uniref:type II toxin-antitoxin system RelE/ParE family toxin n=1 Tax=uncultured Lamprocystis sp. TaxID=543132 RepID=UPI0025F9B2D1|nr:type II toxin-antitoxin system RelE/ParE family toxin [uncultured Lamprocystis sp.]